MVKCKHRNREEFMWDLDWCNDCQNVVPKKKSIMGKYL